MKNYLARSLLIRKSTVNGNRNNTSDRSQNMQPIKDLKMEHEAVRLTLRILDKICQRIEKSEEIIDLGHIDQLLEFFKVFVDRCHHGKEEELLFPALENVGVSREGGPIGVLLHEHQQGREFVRSMNAVLSQYAQGDRKAAAEFVKTARSYINLLDQHIDKENGVLFPLAEKHLSAQEQTQLWEGFEMIEAQKIGAGKHEEFHIMIDQLEKEILK
jgi:hemerythrin-like domain-containing protein